MNVVCDHLLQAGEVAFLNERGHLLELRERREVLHEPGDAFEPRDVLHDPQGEVEDVGDEAAPREQRIPDLPRAFDAGFDSRDDSLDEILGREVPESRAHHDPRGRFEGLPRPFGQERHVLRDQVHRRPRDVAHGVEDRTRERGRDLRDRVECALGRVTEAMTEVVRDVTEVVPEIVRDVRDRVPDLVRDAREGVPDVVEEPPTMKRSSPISRRMRMASWKARRKRDLQRDPHRSERRLRRVDDREEAAAICENDLERPLGEDAMSC